MRLNRILARFCTQDMSKVSKTKLTKLNNRSLLILNGRDTRKLLQGLITNDIRDIKTITHQNQTMNRVAIYTLFLQPKGRLLTDAFLFQPRLYRDGKPQYATDQIWIDIPKQAKKTLKDHLKRHMWRKQVQMHDVQEGEEQYKPTIYSGYNEDNQVMNLLLGGSVELDQFKTGEDDTYSNLIFYDPRGKNFGLRIISMQPEVSIEGHIENRTQEELDLIFQSIGQVPFSFVQNKLPFQYNYDLMNAVSLKKGCYLGQQIMSRGLLTGIIRKRTFPFVLQDKNDSLPQGTIIKNQSSEQIGKVIISNKGQGVVLTSYIPFLQKGTAWPLHFTEPAKGVINSPFQQILSKYYEVLKGKQKVLQDLDL